MSSGPQKAAAEGSGGSAGSRRAMHEYFVSGGSGCEFHEVLAVILLFLLSLYHTCLLRMLLRFLPYEFPGLRMLFDLCSICGPLLFSMVFPGQFLNTIIVFISLNVLLTTIVIFCAHRRAREAHVIHTPPEECGTLRHHSYFLPLSYTRGCVIALTCLAILAVDFPVFPRRFAKTETHGFSLMDLGVGLYICCAAAMACIKKGNRLKSELKSSAGMLLLGIIRIAAVEYLDYQNPIMEYGRHLNFFICFAATKVITAIFYAIFPSSFDVIIGSVIYLIYQLSLQSQAVHFYLHSPNRSGYIAANKEGIASIIGSCCLFLITTAVCRRFVYKVKRCRSEWFYFIFQVSLLSCSCITSSLLMHNDTVLVSRRLVNISYGLWILGLFLVFLLFGTIIRLFDLYTGCTGYNMVTLQHLDPKVDTVDVFFQAFNQAAIWIFLLGNILTGFINRAFDGKISEAGTWLSMTILSGYMLVLALAASLLYRKPIDAYSVPFRDEKSERETRKDS